MVYAIGNLLTFWFKTNRLSSELLDKYFHTVNLWRFMALQNFLLSFSAQLNK